MVRDLTRGKPITLIIRFALSLLVGNICQYLYNMIDTVVVGRYIGYQALAAVGATGSLTFLIIGLTQGVAAGFGVVIGQIFGAGDHKKLKSCAANTIYCSLLLVGVLTAVSCLFTRNMLVWMQTPEDIMDMSYSYLIVMFAGMIFTMFYNVLSSILRALGDTRTPLVVLVFASLLNVVFDLLFIVKFGMGVAGAAYATILAQFISAVLCLIYMLRKMPILHFGRAEARPDVAMGRKLFLVGLPMGLQYSITAVGTILLQAAVNGHGTDVVAAITTGDKVTTVFWLVMDSLGATLAYFCAQNLGAGRIDRVREGVRHSLFVNIGIALFSTGAIILFCKPMAELFIGTGSPEVLQLVADYAFVKAIFMPMLAVLSVWRNSVQGLGYSVPAMACGVMELIARGVAAVFFSSSLMALYLAGPLAWVAADLFLVFAYYIVIRHLSRVIRAPADEEHGEEAEQKVGVR